MSNLVPSNIEVLLAPSRQSQQRNGKQMTIDLTKEEATALIQLIDIAVKAGGLQVANAALVLATKLDEAAKKQKDDE